MSLSQWVTKKIFVSISIYRFYSSYGYAYCNNKTYCNKVFRYQWWCTTDSIYVQNHVRANADFRNRLMQECLDERTERHSDSREIDIFRSVLFQVRTYIFSDTLCHVNTYNFWLARKTITRKKLLPRFALDAEKSTSINRFQHVLVTSNVVARKKFS